MRQAKMKIDISHRVNRPAALVFVFLTGLFAGSAVAQQPGQKTFSSAEAASNAFVTAAQNNDEKGMLEILGADGKEIVSSGDDVEDAQSRANFVEKYKEMHRLVKEADGSTSLYIGAKNWPTPIPLVNKGNSWYFDTGEFAGMRCRPFEFAKSLWPRRRSTTARSTTSTHRKFSVTTGNTMASIGRVATAR